MRIHAKMKFITALCLSVALLAALLSGCGGVRYTEEIPLNLDEISLTEMWDEIAVEADLQEQGAEFGSFYLHTDAEGRINSLYFTFNGWNSGGKPRLYVADLDSKGRIAVRSNESKPSVQPTRHPSGVFEEIDRLGLDSLDPGEEGLAFRVNFQYGSIGYSSSHLDLYSLVDGKLTPLDEILFRTSYPWCVITVNRLLPVETTVESGGVIRVSTKPAPVDGVVSPEDRNTQIWFVSEDINKAETVKYLGN